MIQQNLMEHPSNAKETRGKYMDILTSTLALIQQQSKTEWIKYGDGNTRLFHAKAKQRKMATYIYSINDENGIQVEGFDQVQQTMSKFYQQLLGA